MNEEGLAAALEAEEAPAPAALTEFEFTTRLPAISFTTAGVEPPAASYVGPDDQLLIQCWNAVPGLQLEFYLRALYPRGELKHTLRVLTPTANRLLNNWLVPLTESFILGAAVHSWPSARAGSTYVRVLILRNGAAAAGISQGLIAGYAVAGGGLYYPYPRWVQPCDGPGWMRVIVGTDPAPGAQILETVPAGARWRLLGLRALLQTGAVAGTRYVYLVLDDGAWPWWFSTPQVAQPANTGYYYNWAVNVDARSLIVGGFVQDRLPDQVTLAAGWRIGLVNGLMLAGDDWGVPLLYVEEWIEPGT